MKHPKNVQYILAIDSGATKSEALLYKIGADKISANESLKYSFINLNLLGFAESVKRLVNIVKDAERKAGKGNITIVVAGISGARYEKDRKRIAASVKKASGIKNVLILPDTEIAFAAAFERADKICGILIAGTGSILYYRDNNGKLNRIGGWGRHIGDEGSGHWIAREALYKVTKHFDGRVNAGVLAGVLKKEYGIDHTNIIKKVYHEGFELSQLTKHVFRCAQKGDRQSIDIIKSAAENLLTHFIPLKKKKFTIALHGSLFTEEKLLEKYLRSIAKKEYPHIIIVRSELRPVWGAVKIALLNVK